MGGCCCSGLYSCFFSDTHAPPPPPSTTAETNARRVFAAWAQWPREREREQQRSMQTTQVSVEPSVCDVCGAYIDPSLLLGHRESCRVNTRRHLAAALETEQQRQEQQPREVAARMATTSTLPHNTHTYTASRGPQHGDNMGASDAHAYKRHAADDSDTVASLSDDQMCVVCIDQPREYAFLPCGHVVCCRDCAKRLDACPLCRQPRVALCYVSLNTLSQYLCKHCDQFIAPTLYDGHREVCSLQQQRQREQFTPAIRTDAHDVHTVTCQLKDVVAVAADAIPRDASEDVGTAHSPACSIVSGMDGADGDDVAVVALGQLSSAHALSGRRGGCAPCMAASASSTTSLTPAANMTSATTTTTATAFSATAGNKKHIDKDAETTCAKMTVSNSIHRSRVPASFCVECQRTDVKLVICLPCGHRVLCSECAVKRSTCPVCLADMHSTVLSFQ